MPRRLRPHAVTLVALFATACLPAQQTTPATPASTEMLRSTSTLVVVPTLVLSPSGELIPSLTSKDFQLLDNGARQTITLEDAPERQPVAIVTLLQTGGAARGELSNFVGLASLVEAIAGTSQRRAALITFDSQPEDVWGFTSHIDSFTDGLHHLTPGDDGAAILDAVTFGIHLLQKQPPSVRRVLVVISQRADSGSRSRLEDIVHSLGEQNISVYSLAFSPERAWLKNQFTGERHGQKPYQLGPAGPTLIDTFDLGTPLGVALHALHTNTSAELASLCGGESYAFTGRHDLEEHLTTIANHRPNQYLLSFQPTSSQPGFHRLAVNTPTHAEATVSARSGYWLGPYSLSRTP